MSTVHLHLALTHVPVIVAIVAFVLLAAGTLLRKQDVLRSALWLFVFAAAAGLVVYLTGEGAEHAVEGLAGVSEPIMERHESAALVAMIALGAFGVLSLGALVLFRGEIPRRASMAALALATIPVAALVWTANLGGQIRHSEIRADAQSAQRDGGERDHGRDRDRDDR